MILYIKKLQILWLTLNFYKNSQNFSKAYHNKNPFFDDSLTLILVVVVEDNPWLIIVNAITTKHIIYGCHHHP